MGDAKASLGQLLPLIDLIPATVTNQRAVAAMRRPFTLGDPMEPKLPCGC